MSSKNKMKKTRGNILLEFCVGIVAVLLVAGIPFYLAMLPPRTAPATVVSETGGKKGARVEALRQEKTDLMKYMETPVDGKSEGHWLAHKDTAEEKRACGFTAYISQTSGGVSGRLLVGFIRSEDVLIERIAFVADGDERVIPLQGAGRETVPLSDDNVSEIVELGFSSHLPVYKRTAISENVLLRFLGGNDSFEAELTNTQIRNFGRVLRLYEIELEMTEGDN